MGKESKIEWCTSSWNPWHGCHKVSAGCKYCYMFRDKARYGQDPNVVVRAGDKTFYAPLKWAEPKKIFTCSWSDFFIEESDAWRDEAFAIMALTPQHTYQVLTKRPDRMWKYLRPGRQNEVVKAACNILRTRKGEFAYTKWLSEYDGEWPPKNVWLGVSVEDQKTADERIPHLLNTPAAVRFLSVEPLLGPVDLRNVKPSSSQWLDAVTGLRGGDHSLADCNSINWVIIGGESGPDARPFDVAWARSIIRQCKDAGVPVFTKQLGAKPYDSDLRIATPRSVIVPIDSDWTFTDKLADRKDGDWSEWPEDVRIREFPNV